MRTFGNMEQISTMRAHGFLVLVSGGITLATVIPLSSTSGQPAADPILVLKGYSVGVTNTAQVAKFELHNRSSQTLRLFYQGTTSPLSAPILTRFTAPLQPPKTNSLWAVNATLGSWFEEDRELPPGQRLLLNFPLVPGKDSVQIGLAYYVGGTEQTNRHEIWCSQTVRYQTSITNTPLDHPKPAAGGSK